MLSGIKRVLLLLLLGIYCANVYATTDEESYLEIRGRYNELKRDKKKRRYRVYWSRIASQLRKLSERAEPKLRVRIFFTLAELYRELRKITLSPYDFESAVKYYEKVYSEFPDSNLADDALFYTGKLYLEVENDAEKAITFFEKIISSYPKGDYFERASTILNSIDYDTRRESKVESAKEDAPKKEETQPVAEGERAADLMSLEDVILKIGEYGAICEMLVSGKIRYLYKELPEDKHNNKPPRIYVDLIDTRLSESIQKIKSIERGFIKGVRIGQFADNTVRIVFDLLSIKSYLIFVQENPYKIVVQFGDISNQGGMTIVSMREVGQQVSEVKGEKETAILPEGQNKIGASKEINVKIVESIKRDLKKNIIEKKRDFIPLSRQLGLKVKRIVIDPGHGGTDYGAIGPSGLKEKDVALDIALELAKIIKKNSDIEVILTRESDITLKLSERTALAKARRADLFISIHANASKNKKISGIEVYYLNNTDDRASQRVAMLENINSDKTISDLKMTLLDLAISANVDESMRLAQYVQNGIVTNLKKRYPNVKDRGVKYALFYVLLGTEIPSILIETSFISNPLEEKRLRSRGYRRLIAKGIFEGIMRYIRGADE